MSVCSEMLVPSALQLYWPKKLGSSLEYQSRFCSKEFFVWTFYQKKTIIGHMAILFTLKKNLFASPICRLLPQLIVENKNN